MNIKIICVGKLKEQYLKDACDEYLKRLSRFANVEVLELSEYKLPDSPSGADTEKAIQKESESILKAIPKQSHCIALDVKGKELSSEEFANHLKDAMMKNGNISFVIGGSNGYDNSVRQCADLKLSFSKLTFPHQLFRVMLLEQVYRAFKINSGEKYHK